MTQDERLARELEQWRNKYYDGLAQLDRKEKAWQKTENLLRQCISRLTLAADSSDRELNQQLDRLRSAIRKNSSSDELEALIQSLTEHLVRLDQQRRSHSKPPAPLDVLRRLADGITFPRGLGHKAKAYSKALGALSADTDYQPHLQDLIALIGEAFDWLAEQQTDGSGGAGNKGLLGRLFRREEVVSPSAEEAAPVVLQATDDGLSLAKTLLTQILTSVAAPTELRARAAAAVRRDELQRVATELATLLPPTAVTPVLASRLSPQEVLLQLLERLAVPPELHGEAEAIKNELAIADDEDELGQILGRIADLVTTMRTRAQNLDHLKQAVQERVDTIRRHMEIFRHTEDERIERAEQEVKKLNVRLRLLETESESLRGRILQERNQALIDPLTEISNRLAYNERITQEYARWKRYRSPLVFTIWDVDNFKRINDTYGHQAGDKVLKVVAKLLATQVRETDFVARYGGEEFVILLPETDMPQARVATEKIRAAVEACEFHYRGERVLITISCGLAQFTEQDDPDAVFARADAAMYRAKAAGRNCCRADGDT